VVEAAEARARGIAIQFARRMAGEPAALWLARSFYGGPWPTRPLADGVEQQLVELSQRTTALGGSELPTDNVNGFELLVPDNGCQGLAFRF
jgi:hypothetical protein